MTHSNQLIDPFFWDPDSAIPISQHAFDLVRCAFNPSGLSEVDRAKVMSAALITMAEKANKDPRLSAIAAAKIEEAAMWLVKAMTA
jgi:hypothetical protein